MENAIFHGKRLVFLSAPTQCQFKLISLIYRTYTQPVGTLSYVSLANGDFYRQSYALTLSWLTWGRVIISRSYNRYNAMFVMDGAILTLSAEHI